MQKTTLVLFLLISQLLQSAVAEPVVKKPVLHWCLDHFPRFHEFKGRGLPTGPSVVVMQELARRVGFELSYSPETPIARCFRQMGTGEADLMINLNFTEERARLMYLFPYNETIPESLYLRKNDLRLIDQISQLSPLILVTVRNYIYNPTLMALIKNQKEQHIEVDSIEAGFELLRKGRVDGLIVPTQSSLEVIRNTPSLHFQFRKAALTFKFGQPRYINIGLSRKSKHLYLKDQIEQAVALMKEDGTVDRLYQLPDGNTEQQYLVSGREPLQSP
ncbi:ABC transporter substrate-binding protein [Rheinheimera sp.]|uniref:substrate-binding periplasmic protein n=1 Tax=Rheinheimera sp. TaxID=1869214 RepID=UPI0027B8D54D|nr:transporter substrate-binding domain-containing protein [Rheinheimera sp.]